MRALALSLIMMAAVLAAPTTAQAASYVDVWADDVTVPVGDCRDTSIAVSGDWWGFENLVSIEILDPYGESMWSDEVYDSTGQVTFDYPACTGEPAGTYSVEATVVEYDEYGTVTDTTWGSGTFRVTHRQPKKRSRLTKTKRNIHQGPYRTAVIGDLEVLNAPPRHDRGQRIYLLTWAGDWYVIDKARTNRKGLVGWRFKPNNYSWALCFAGNPKIKSSCTKAFTTRAGSGRALAPATLTPALDRRDEAPADMTGLVSRR